MIDLVSKRCKLDGCNTYVKSKYSGYCARCFFYLFPDNQITKNFRTKEKTVCDEIIESFSTYTWLNNEQIDKGCSNRRPDLFLDLLTHVILIEIDENSHKYYCDENMRICQLSQDVAHRPIIFLRFNPDGYIKSDGKKIPACWSFKKNSNLLCLKNKKDWKFRISKLKERVNFYLTNIPEKTIEKEYLFYDEN